MTVPPFPRRSMYQTEGSIGNFAPLTAAFLMAM
uniref:Uncharacterized protein n=1 Tax=Rhizophora mucronata TaxID=61149 RepID=A0A2P2JED9_RHIMU